MAAASDTKAEIVGLIKQRFEQYKKKLSHLKGREEWNKGYLQAFNVIIELLEHPERAKAVDDAKAEIIRHYGG
jgi:hypothetical protein